MEIKTKWSIGDAVVVYQDANPQVGVVTRVRTFTNSIESLVKYGITFHPTRCDEEFPEDRLCTPDEWLSRLVSKNTSAIQRATTTVEELKVEVARKQGKP